MTMLEFLFRLAIYCAIFLVFSFFALLTYMVIYL